MSREQAATAISAAMEAGLRATYDPATGKLGLRHDKTPVAEVWYDDESGAWVRASKFKRTMWQGDLDREDVARNPKRYISAHCHSLADLVGVGAPTFPDALAALGGEEAIKAMADKAAKDARYVPYYDPNW
ncbi:hypothetical protein [Aureimonas sp. SK2]|uniref:hypothetical protein n=1 Tax=Aureimonas sp. SK2 TaxID=3015992 RepID=UPI00244436C5|nr:hypothetical protein [Aureimonas sp. SK2]